MKVVIVGGVAGGASAAARIRRLDEHAQIIMIERSGYVSYANCGLPYYVGGVIKEQEELTLQTPESFWDRFRIDVRVRQEVTAINPAEKNVTVRALDSGKSYTETYDKLLLAPGAKPTVPALSGVSSERVFTLRTVEDTLRIRRFVEDQKPKTAVLAGGGFIGLEMAENLVEMMDLQTPVISILIGEGGSGGALALAVADRVLMLENAVYAILSPEGFASILWKDAQRSGEAAELMKLTAPELKKLGVIDGIVREPEGGAQTDPSRTLWNLDRALTACLEPLLKESAVSLTERRYQKFRALGRGKEDA